jgi:PAS domain S-box-containing protein
MLRRGHYGLVLFEHETGDTGATKLLAEFLQTGRAVPFIVLTDQADEKAVAEIIQAGACDCLEKTQFTGANLLRTIRCTLNLQSTQLQRNLAEVSLSKLSCAVEQTGDAIMITNSEGIIEYVNPPFQAQTGYSSGEAIGQAPSILTSGQQASAIYRELWETISVGNVYQNILVNRKKNGELYYVDESTSAIRDSLEPSRTLSLTAAISAND